MGCRGSAAERSHEKSAKSSESHVALILAQRQQGLPPPLPLRLRVFKRDKDGTEVINIWFCEIREGRVQRTWSYVDMLLQAQCDGDEV